MVANSGPLLLAARILPRPSLGPAAPIPPKHDTDR